MNAQLRQPLDQEAPPPRSPGQSPDRPITRAQLLAAGVVGFGLALNAWRPVWDSGGLRASRRPFLGAPPNAGRAGSATSLTSEQARELEDEFRRGHSTFGPSPLPHGRMPSGPVPRVQTYNTPAAPPPDAPPIIRAEWQMLSALNEERMRHGLTPLAPDATLAAVARWRSDDMGARSYFSHDIGGYVVFHVLRDIGYGYRAAGENLAYNYYAEDRSVTEAHAALMRSTSHRENLLRPDYTYAGIGAAVLPDGKRIYTQLFSRLFEEAQPSPAGIEVPPPQLPSLPLMAPANPMQPPPGSRQVWW